MFVLFLLCCGPRANAQMDFSPGYSSQLSFSHDGIERRYDLYVPVGYDGTDSVPLLIDLHGITSNSQIQKERSGFDRIAESEGIIVLYPQGVGDSWNVKSFCCPPASNEQIDDAGFVAALLAATVAEANVDTARIYASGYSNGGGLAARLACDSADTFAAVALFSSLTVLDPPCLPSRPISVMALHGDTDSVIPYDGGSVLGFVTVASQAEVFAFWKDTNSCSGNEPDQLDVLGDRTRCETYTDCASDVKTALCTTRSTVNFGHDIYANQDGLDLAMVAWDFLEQFQLPATSSAYTDQVQAMYVAYYGRPGRSRGYRFLGGTTSE